MPWPGGRHVASWDGGGSVEGVSRVLGQSLPCSTITQALGFFSALVRMAAGFLAFDFSNREFAPPAVIVQYSKALFFFLQYVGGVLGV